jgi:hypothetical protein
MDGDELALDLGVATAALVALDAQQLSVHEASSISIPSIFIKVRLTSSPPV